MKLVERQFVKPTNEHYETLDQLCFKSKNIYNRANYIIKDHYSKHNEYLNYKQLDKIMQKEECYKQLPSKVSQQTLILLDRNWKSFFASSKDFKTCPHKYKSPPQPPKYLRKQEGRFPTIYSNQAISKKQILSKTNIKINTNKKYTEIRIIPKPFGVVIEIVYDEPEQQKKTSSKCCFIDLGINNLAAVSSDHTRPLLVNGRIAKSFNQYYNKKLSLTKSKKKRMQIIKKRYFRFENYFHHVSKLLVNYCLKYNVGRIIIGYNEEWKQKINLGKKNNQEFCSIPFDKLIQKIIYKCQLQGIDVILTEESYTSKSSFFDNDPLPCYGDKYIPDFSGKRVERGLYKCKDGFVLNADVNGSLNIGRKVIHDIVVDRSLVARPVKVNPLQIYIFQ